MLMSPKMQAERFRVERDADDYSDADRVELGSQKTFKVQWLKLGSRWMLCDIFKELEHLFTEDNL